MKCEKCGEEIPPEEIDNHNLTCSYAFSSKDYEGLIPCEICNELISFEDYARHLSVCSQSRAPTMQQLPNFNIQHFPFLNSANINPNTIFAEPDNIENDTELRNNINIINNDPIARTLFSLMIGELPVLNEPTAESEQEDEATDSEQNNTRPATPMDVDTDDDMPELENDPVNDNEEPVNENNTENEEFNFLPPLLNGNSNVNINLNQPIFQELLNNQNSLNILENILNVNPNNQPPEEDNYEELINLEDHVVGISNINDVSQILFEEVECPICSETKMVKRLTKCEHSFCDECLQEWLKSSKKCPVCMVELE